MNSRIRALTFVLLACASGCGDRAPDPDAWLGDIAPLPAAAAPGARYPHLAGGADGAPVVMSWVEPGPEGVERLRYATLVAGRKWSVPATAAEGRDWFVNWADFPSVVPFDASRWAAHWFVQRPGSVYSYDVMTALSSDAGRHWSAPYSPHDDGTPTEHGFVSFAWRDGGPYAVWLDGRNTAGGGHGEAGHGQGAGAMTLRGAALSATGPSDGTEIDARVCDCCQTDVATTSDAMLVVYRDRSEDETRDIHLARLGRDGSTVSVTVNADGWRIDACPVNGPAVDARGDTVAVAWFTAPDVPRVRLAFSRDGGRTFEPPFEVARGSVAGRVDVAVLEDGRAVVSWLAETPAGAAILVQPFGATGPVGTTRAIATSNVARSSGFPRMIETGGGLLFAWTRNEAVPQVATAYASLR